MRSPSRNSNVRVVSPAATLPRDTPTTTNKNVGAVLAGIDDCIKQWKAARHAGQAVLTSLSNTLLLRTHLDKSRSVATAAAETDDGFNGGANATAEDAHSSSVWGALAGASGGRAVDKVFVASEARVRSLHAELTSLQDAMLAAAGGVRRHAADARRLYFSMCVATSTSNKGVLTTRNSTSAGGDVASGVKVSAVAAADGGNDGRNEGNGSGGDVSAAGRHEEERYSGGLADDPAIEMSTPTEPAGPVGLAELVSKLSLSSGTTRDGRVEEGGDDGGDHEDSSDDVVCGGYGGGDLAECAAEVSDMLMKEALVTATIIQGVTDLVTRGDREALTIYAAAWMMQPYLDARRLKELQAMVVMPPGRGRGR